MLLFMDGFEGYGIADLSKFWDYAYATQGYTTIDATGRNGGKCINSYISSTFGQYSFRWNNNYAFADQVLIIGFAIKINYALNDLSISLSPPGASAKSGKIQITENRDIIIWITSSVIEYSIYNSPFALDLGTWYYFELKWRVSNTVGAGELKLNEQTLYSFSGVDNRSSLATGDYVSQVNFSNPSQGQTSFDDIYILDTTGSKNNDFLGDIRIDAIHPNGAGNYTQLTPSAGNNYECIDEDPYDDSDYVEGANAGEKDSYSYVNAPTDIDDSAIFGAQLNNVSKRSTETDNIKIKGFLRTGSTDYEETTAQSLPDIFHNMIAIWEDDPSDSNPWTQAKINACEFGMEVA